MPTYGRKSAQFVDLLGYLSISTPQVLEKVCGGGYVVFTLYVVWGMWVFTLYVVWGMWYGVFTLSEIPVHFYTTSAGGGMDCIHCMELHVHVATCKGLEYAYYVYLHNYATVGRSNKTD